MKKIFTFLLVLFFAITAYAQIEYQTIFEFEDGVDTTIWIPFANGVGTKADLSVVENPLANNVNSSDSVLWMHIYTGAEGWVGFWVDLDTLETDGIYGAIEITDESYMMSLMVNKPVSNSVRIKLERGLTDPGSYTFTVADTNNLVNEWELLEFDFTEVIGHYMRRLTIFPEPTSKADRTTELDVYIDNIGIQNSGNTVIKEFDGAKMKIYPNPAEHRMAVLYPGMTGLRILNINGQEIRTIKFGTANQKVIEVGYLSSGPYFVTAITAKGNFTMPFIKK
jgi:hypothetical protein